VRVHAGVNAIITNLVELFQAAEFPLKETYAAAIATSAQAIACLAAGPAIERAGRRVIWAVSFGLVTLADVAYAVSRYPSLAPA
jgi:hypothetical protein